MGSVTKPAKAGKNNRAPMPRQHRESLAKSASSDGGKIVPRFKSILGLPVPSTAGETGGMTIDQAAAYFNVTSDQLWVAWCDAHDVYTPDFDGPDIDLNDVQRPPGLKTAREVLELIRQLTNEQRSLGIRVTGLLRDLSWLQKTSQS